MINTIIYQNRLLIRSLSNFNSMLNAFLCVLAHASVAAIACYMKFYLLLFPITLILQWTEKFHKQYYYSLDPHHFFAPYGAGYTTSFHFAAIDFFDASTTLLLPHLLLIALFRPHCLLAALCTTAANSLFISYASLIIKRQGLAKWFNGLWVAIAMLATKVAEHLYPHAQQTEQKLIEYWPILTAIAIGLLFGSLLLYFHGCKALLRKKPFYTTDSIERNRYRRKKQQ